MADFNINALGAFRNVDFGNADAIVNIKQGGGVGQNGKLGNFFCKMFRSSATEANNNAARTELLRALGQGFGIEGMTEKGGKTRSTGATKSSTPPKTGPTSPRPPRRSSSARRRRSWFRFRPNRTAPMNSSRSSWTARRSSARSLRRTSTRSARPASSTP